MCRNAYRGFSVLYAGIGLEHQDVLEYMLGRFALCCAMGGLLCLFGLGMLAVLWMQHYPLAGVTIGCLGLVLCFFSAAGYAVTLLWRTKKKQA